MAANILKSQTVDIYIKKQRYYISFPEKILINNSRKDTLLIRKLVSYRNFELSSM